MPIQIGAKRESDFADPIGMLSDCHRRIEMFLNVLVRVTEVGSLTGETRSAFEAALRYFREAAPKHTADEEESVFPRLRALGKPELAALLAQVDSLEEEHVCANRSHAEIDRLGRLWLETGALTAAQVAELLAELRQLQDLYRHHIAMEDTEIFPAAKAALPAEDRSAIGIEMAARRNLATIAK
ncbi:MAG: hemerythrin domain-containing protein [Candidatus Solibacter sp.]